MSEDKKKERISLTKYDPIESPEEIIAADKDIKRRKAFDEVFKRIDLFAIKLGLLPNRKKPTSGGGGTAFTQSIVVTPEKATLETKEVTQKEEKQEERERED